MNEWKILKKKDTYSETGVKFGPYFFLNIKLRGQVVIRFLKKFLPMPILVSLSFQLFGFLIMKFQQHKVVWFLLNYTFNERQNFRRVKKWVLEYVHTVKATQSLLRLLFCQCLDQCLFILCEKFFVELYCLSFLLYHVIQSNPLKWSSICNQLIK